MTLSPAERSYIYDSLVSPQVARTDSRKPTQFRPLKATCSFLPNSNGSSRIFTADGLECITSVKAKVLRTKDIGELIKVDVDIQGQRDDSDLCLTTSSILTRSLVDNLDHSTLKLTDKYYYQLFIDIVILSLPTDFQMSSYTLYSLISLTSMGCYLALKSTRLPLLISTTNDKEVEEEPTFSDDWESCTDLIPKDSEYNPTLLFVVGIVGNNVLVDPSLEEQQVLEHGICVGYSNGKIVPPLESITLSTVGGGGVNKKTIFKGIDMVRQIGGVVEKALDLIAEQEPEDFERAF
ncbi:DEKNAAC102068 [Brettanomyces naardenensis]|uniref:Ribosomal RNA-processing protein 42 n=1 Tax=Brettanomyces naardenensis TaxID=13370 RepID=A0A448YJV8_BRENA|nr:DEKNAAC102068 [Brettanomyces naardenensis]